MGQEIKSAYYEQVGIREKELTAQNEMVIMRRLEIAMQRKRLELEGLDPAWARATFLRERVLWDMVLEEEGKDIQDSEEEGEGELEEDKAEEKKEEEMVGGN